MKNIHSTHNKKNGMTTIELVVVFGIFAALATTVLFSYREFTSNIKLQNLTQDIGLQIRQAQNRAVSGIYPPLVDGQDGPPSNWAPSYGLYFSKEQGQNDRFTVFFDRNEAAILQATNLGDKTISGVDNNGDCIFSGGSECIDQIRMTGGEVIDAICFNQFADGLDDDDCPSSDTVNIVFTRPLNRATISAGGGEFQDDVSIYIKSTTGNSSVIRVTSAGQIIVE